MGKDIKFLEEMIGITDYLLNYKYDVTRLQQLNDMLIDWKRELEQKLNLHGVVRPASELRDGGELLQGEAGDTVAAGGQKIQELLNQLTDKEIVELSERYFGRGVRKSSEGQP